MRTNDVPVSLPKNYLMLSPSNRPTPSLRFVLFYSIFLTLEKKLLICSSLDLAMKNNSNSYRGFFCALPPERELYTLWYFPHINTFVWVLMWLTVLLMAIDLSAICSQLAALLESSSPAPLCATQAGESRGLFIWCFHLLCFCWSQ